MSDSKNTDIVIDALIKRVETLEKSGIPGVRDFFATSALSALANNSYCNSPPDAIAKYCYQIADAMMKRRNDGY